MAKITRRRGKRVIVFRDQFRHQRLKTLPDGISMRDAKAELRRIENEVEGGTFVSKYKSHTFKQAAEKYLESKRGNVRSSTLSVIRINLGKHFKELDELRVCDITAPIIEKWIKAKQAKGMHIETLRKCGGHLNQVLDYAVRKQWMAVNPWPSVSKPKKKAQNLDMEDYKDAEEMSVIDQKDIAKLADATPKPIFKVLFLMAGLTGARQGELLGLQWKDIL